MQRILKPSLKDNRDYDCEEIMFSQNIFKFNLPDKYDLTKKLLPVRNQGIQDSCVAMTAACIKEYQEYLNSFKKNKIIYFSPQFIYNNRKNQDSTGMTSRNLMKILHKFGCCLEKTYPYGKIEHPSLIPREVYLEASKYKIKGYARINTICGLKNALINYGPCLIAFPIYNCKKYFWKKKSNEKLKGGHTLTVVGYNEKGFILRNSWGKKWGNNGYVIYPYSHFGSHWEIWSTFDDKLTNINVKNKSNKCFSILSFIFKKLICN